jgi:hypothetical protein
MVSGSAGYVALPGECPAVASWNGESWHHCSRLVGHKGSHLSHNGSTTWAPTGDGEPSWTAPWPKANADA